MIEVSRKPLFVIVASLLCISCGTTEGEGIPAAEEVDGCQLSYESEPRGQLVLLTEMGGSGFPSIDIYPDFCSDSYGPVRYTSSAFQTIQSYLKRVEIDELTGMRGAILDIRLEEAVMMETDRKIYVVSGVYGMEPLPAGFHRDTDSATEPE